MELSGITLGRRRESTILRRFEAARAQEPDYDHIGSTLGTAPSGIRVHCDSLTVAGELADARTALETWAAHAGIRGRVVPATGPALGGTVCVVAPFGPFEMCVPDRIVAVIDEPNAVGFAYGTLPGHPERGEELFLAEALDNGQLRLSVTIHAVPASLAARLGAPLTRLLQRAAAKRYLGAWAKAIIEADSASGPRP